MNKIKNKIIKISKSGKPKKVLKVPLEHKLHNYDDIRPVSPFTMIGVKNKVRCKSRKRENYVMQLQKRGVGEIVGRKIENPYKNKCDMDIGNLTFNKTPQNKSSSQMT